MPTQFLLISYASLLILSGVITFPCRAAQAHRHAEPMEPEQWGSVSFPVSCSERLQAPFDHAVALLHSFGYAAADKQFREITDEEPTCAMAYWGQALSLYRQLWDRPSESDLEKGHELLHKAEAAGIRTEREREYIQAAAAFYQAGHVSYDARTLAYSRGLDKIRLRYPEDSEAAIFYALSLLASPHADDHNLAARKTAVAVLLPLFSEKPNHPGIAHYLIHACDNPQMAYQALSAALRYSQIAPASAHALHMPSHIFVRLGMWPEDVQSNLLSKTVAEKQSTTEDRLHAMDFLLYAYLQQGQYRKAGVMEKEALQVTKNSFSKNREGYFYYVQVHFPVLLALETRDWSTLESLPFPAGVGPEYEAVLFWAQAVAAGHLRHLSMARSAVEKYEKALEMVKKSSYAYVAEGMAANGEEARGWLAFLEGDSSEATRLLERVADRQDKAGKGEVEIPAREMLADLLLELDRPQQALEQYGKSLKTNPNRFVSLYGAGYSAELTHQPQLAKVYYQQLVNNCMIGRDTNGKGNPELDHAKSYLHSKLP